MIVTVDSPPLPSTDATTIVASFAVVAPPKLVPTTVKVLPTLYPLPLEPIVVVSVPDVLVISNVALVPACATLLPA